MLTSITPVHQPLFLQLKMKVNQDHSNLLQQQRNSLNKKNLEVAATDRRLAELRQRLWKKKAALQQKENQLVRVGRRPASFNIPHSSFIRHELVPPGGLSGRGSSAWRPVQGGSGGAVRSVRSHLQFSGASRAGPSGDSGETHVPRQLQPHGGHAGLFSEAPSQTRETGRR